MNIYVNIEKLLTYAQSHLMLDDLDVVYARNLILDELKLSDYVQYEVDMDEIYDMSVADGVITPIVNYAIENGVITADMAEKFADKIMSIMLLRPSEVSDIFQDSHACNSIKAFEWLYDYAIKSNYVNYTAISQNKHWEAKGTKGKLEVTINTSRQEKSSAEVESASKKSEVYPQCVICQENEGYSAKGNFKRTLRTVPLTLAGEDWFWQFSPYSYFNQHGIAVSAMHEPMDVNAKTLQQLVEFVDFAPNYFIGCNASLPRVGGSILSHNHFQGGKASMPMFKAPILKTLKSEECPYIKIEMLDWYTNTIRLSYTNKENLVAFADMICTKWENYSNEALGITAKTSEQHNAITPIARKGNDGNYIIDIILRNNAVSEEYPDGIFCAHKEYQPIKAEAVGLIEAMGLFILPARLDAELDAIQKFLTKEERYSADSLEENLVPFKAIIEKLIKEAGSKKLSSVEAYLNIKDEVNRICECILENTAVFKSAEAFMAFLSECGIK